MPDQLGDVVAVVSPTTLAPSLKNLDKLPIVPVREGRSQSLTTLPRRASTASVLTVDNHDILSESEGGVRHPRRVLSSGTGCSLSLLQQELGYPRSARMTVDSHRHRRKSLLETTLENSTNSACRSARNVHSSSSCSVGTMDSASDFERSQSLPEPEGESQMDQLQLHDHSWTFNSVSCSPRSEAAGVSTEDRDEEDDENFMDYRSASVTGYSRDTDGVVYYEVIVRSTAHGPLSAYKVRRRYSEFRDLHAALSKVMPVSHRKLASVTAMASIRDDHSEDEDSLVGLRFSITECSQQRELSLPPLPDKGGMWSFLQFDSVPLLERRAEYFHAMLVAAQRHPAARASRLLNDFVGTPPDLVSMYSSVENSYVSLNRFAAPKLSFDIEIQERKEKAKSIRRRRSSLKRQSFTGSLENASSNTSQ
ncbi:putative Phox domain, PX domain superfamily protein [Plasmopara halstedii]